MEIRQLRYFLAVAHHRNFTRAAQSVRISQPSLSVQIQALEEELGAPLFHRLGRHVALTDAGKVLFDHAQRALCDLDHAKEAIREVSGAERGQLAIGVLWTVNTYLIPPVISRYRRRFPHLHLQIRSLPSRDIERELLDNRLDLGLCLLPPSSPRLVVNRFYEETLCLVGPPIPGPSRPRIKMRDLADLPLVLMPVDYCLRKMVEEACAHGQIEPKVTIEMTSPEGILEVVNQGAGWTILPELYVRHRRKHLPVQIVKLYDPIPRHTVGFAFLAHRYLGPGAEAFMDFCRAVLQDIQHNTFPQQCTS